MDTREIIQEISAKRVSKKLEKAGLDVETINSQGQSVIENIKSILKSTGAKPDSIIKKGMKIGQNKNLARSVKKDPEDRAKKTIQGFAQEKFLGSNPSRESLASAFILYVYGISVGLTQRFRIDSDYAFFLTAMSLSAQIQAISTVKNESKSARATYSWVNPIRNALGKYKQKDIQKVLVSFILTNSNLPFLKKAWKRGATRMLGVSGTGIAALAIIGTIGGHFVWYTWNSWEAISTTYDIDTDDPMAIINIVHNNDIFNDFLSDQGLGATWADSLMNFSTEIGEKVMNALEPAIERGKELGQQGLDVAKSAIDQVSDDISNMISSG